MDPRSPDFLLQETESQQFEEEGYFIVENAIPQELVEALIPVADQVDSEERTRMGKGEGDRINHFDFLGKDTRFLQLIDWYKIFPKVWGILGWNIQLYHTHMTFTPPAPVGESLEKDGLGLSWHQDSGRLNNDIESIPRPRISLKVAYFLTDTSENGRGNFHVLPGSHLINDFQGSRKDDIEGAVPVCVKPGSAVFFDRRIWHSGSTNYWHEPRRVLFYGYAYRWLRPRDDMEVGTYLKDCDPIQLQLLGKSASGGRGYTSPTEEDVPLKSWIEENVGKEAVVA
jgi:ectoine hydroxylase